ncbi:MAG: hypothetical protein ACI9N9_000899 [Enterobacterales bacterium]|jgi:hypothetical protein
MAINNLYLQHKIGADMIKKYCAMYLFNRGISLKLIEWSTDIFSDLEEHILIINSQNWDATLTFQTTELEDYSRHLGISKIEHKIGQFINDAV